MATMQGVYSASVLDNRDPDGLARVRVRVAALADTSGGNELWARVATMMAGRNRGTWFMPDVGDEVLVAFERGDLSVPIVIGALWNEKARPPSSGANAGNGVKLIRSRNGVTLRIRDDSSNNSLVIETPGGQRVTLQDGPASVRIEDSNGNAVTLAASGVTVNASAKLTINASNVDVNASLVTVDAGMSRFSGVVQCDTLISTSVVSASYSPGAGNQL
jgi:uncharacterized protein involved in type VI secretion and phage assembly